MKKRFLTAFIAMFLMLVPVSSVTYAIDTQPSTMTIIMKYGDDTLSGINVAICRVADAREENGSIVYDVVQAFDHAGDDFANLTKEKNIALAASLDAYASANNIERSSKITGSDGKAVFPGLSAGLYLVAQLNSEKSEFTIAPYLVSVPQPNLTKDGWEYDFTVYPKTDPIKRETETVFINVFKIWVGTNSPPSQILVQLYRGGNLHGEPVVLNAGNYWSYTWKDLNPDEIWSVDEIEVPKGFIKIVSGDASTGFVITNKRTPNYEVPQTGITPEPGVPKTFGNPGTPSTGDTGNIGLWLIIAAASIVGLLIVLFVLNPKRRNRMLERK